MFYRVIPCTPTVFNWTGGAPPFRLKYVVIHRVESSKSPDDMISVTAADITENSGLTFGISFDGLQEHGFTFSVPFPVGESILPSERLHWKERIAQGRACLSTFFRIQPALASFRHPS